MLAAFLLASELALAASAQSIPAAPKFEVVSIKRCRDTDVVREGGPSPERIDLICVTTASLIRLAYLVFPTGRPNAPVSPAVFQQPLAGGPAWIDSERYRIDAKAERPANVEMMKGPMMQALLADRFQLKLHRATRETAVFELTVAKGGPRLQPAKTGACVVFDRNHPPLPQAPGHSQPVICGSVRKSPGGGFDIPGVTMAALCRQLTAYVDREIVDRTAIPGVFDVHLDLTPADLAFPDAPPDPSSSFIPGDGRALAAALEKLGLRLRPAKTTTEFLVIDHVERPSEN
jgi:uncharacterized protein (TIGR03435 family)